MKLEKKHWVVIILVALTFGVIILASWQVPYSIKEEYTEKEPNTIINSYTIKTSKEGCLKYPDCYCASSGVYDIGQCSACVCEVEEVNTVWETVKKTRHVTKYCSALNKLFLGC